MGVDVAGQGAGGWIDRGAPEQADHGAVAAAGLEHQGAPAAAFSLHVDHRPDPASQRIGGEEQPRTDVAGFLAVGHQQHQVPRLRTGEVDGAGDLQLGRDIGAVVGGSGRTGDGVVVGHQGDGGLGPVASGQDADHVLGIAALDEHRRRIDLAAVGLPGLDVGLQTHGLAALGQIVTHPVVLDRAGGVRLGADRLDVGEGAQGGELQRRRIGWQGRGGARRHPREHARQGEARDKGSGSKHATSPEVPSSQGDEP